MNAKKILALALAALMLLSLAACGQSAEPIATEAPAEPTEAPVEATEAPAEDTSVTVTDMTGREITLEEPATRIVALTASDCEIICALGGMDLLVGRGTYCDYPAEALEPQVVIMAKMAQTEEQIKALEDAGVHVVVSDAQDIEGTYAAIRMIGALLGKNEEAETVIDGMKTTFESLKGVCGDGEKTIYFEVSPLEYGLWTAGANTFMNEIAELLGLKNCFADVEGWAEISEEQVLERNPDYILTISMYFGEGPTPEEEIASRAGWENVTAVKNGAILNLQNNELSRPAPRLAEGAQMLADFIAGVEANDKAA